MKQYRIGDFARALGVTTDFLKHYENEGLIQVQQHENGYRWYPFDQSARIIEYLRLKNYGVQLKDMKALLTCTPENALHALDEKATDMETRAQKLLALAAEHRRIRAWYDVFHGASTAWEIRRMPGQYFLPHTARQDLHRDPTTITLLSAWSEMFPVTKSALSVRFSGASRGEDLRWGFALEDTHLETLNLPHPSPVEHLHFEKAFVFHFSHLDGAFSMQAVIDGTHAALTQMTKLDLKPMGTGLLISEMRVANDDGSTFVGMGRFVIPIED